MTNNEVRRNIEGLETLEDASHTYQQVAAMRMRKIRDAVLQNRAFYSALSSIYLELTATYIKIYNKSFRSSTNGKKVAVLITSNTGLYGDIIKKTFDLFISSHAKDDYELVVTGRLGKNWLETSPITKPFRYYDLPDGINDLDKYIRDIFNNIMFYDEISVYHGLLNSITNQIPSQSKITQKLEVGKENNQPSTFIFEPSIDELLKTFEKQLVYSFFDQSINEANLAKYGSRMMSLDESIKNIAKSLASTRTALVRSKHVYQNKKQLEQVYSMNFWR